MLNDTQNSKGFGSRSFLRRHFDFVGSLALQRNERPGDDKLAHRKHVRNPVAVMNEQFPRSFISRVSFTSVDVEHLLAIAKAPDALYRQLGLSVEGDSDAVRRFQKFIEAGWPVSYPLFSAVGGDENTQVKIQVGKILDVALFDPELFGQWVKQHHGKEGVEVAAIDYEGEPFLMFKACRVSNFGHGIWPS